jgi:hypothetical protein
MTMPAKTLHTNWTFETHPDLISGIVSDIAKIIQEELDREVIDQVQVAAAINRGWICVRHNPKYHITPEWCKTYIKGNYYQSVNYKFYFAEQTDAVYFSLKWSE